MLRLTLAWITAAPMPAQIGNATWAKPVARDFTEPAWLDEGLVFVGNWEPLLVRLRLGTDAVSGQPLPIDIVERYRREHTEETVLKLKEAGVNMIILHFYKAGLEAEKEDLEYTKKLAALCRKHGLRVGTYIGATLFAETLLRDIPEAKEWACYDERGNAARYGGLQTHRYLPDFNHPGYIEHMKRVARVAVEQVKTDLVHFDNHNLQPPPRSCATPEVNRRFRAFLRRKYTPELLKSRLGFADVSAVGVPSWFGLSDPAAISPVTDPLVQEWIDFRAEDFAEYYGTIASFIHGLNPNVVVELNCHGVYGTNRAFLQGVDHARLTPHGSVFWTEESSDAMVDGRGNMVSKIRSYKVARTLGQTLFVNSREVTRTPVDPKLRAWRLRMAEAMAFNRNCLGDVGKPLDAYEMSEEFKRYIWFYRKNNRLFSSTRPVADVAVLRSFPSMAYDSVEPHLATTLMEQLLIQYKVPFAIVFDQQLADLSAYAAVVLADQESLSDRAIGQLRSYVAGGGGLVATCRTSLFNDWRRRRPDLGLSEILGVRFLEDGAQERRGKHGRGRTAYLPRVVPADPIPSSARSFGPQFWKPPKNAQQIAGALRYAARTAFSVEFEGAPLTTAAELADKLDGSARLLHWLNYQVGSRVPTTAVTVVVPPRKRVAAIELFTPDRDGLERPAFKEESGRVRFTLPETEIYTIAVLRLEDK